MLQAVLARINVFCRAAPMSKEELEAHAEVVNQQHAQEAQRQADILAERAALRLNGVGEPIGEQQAYWKSEDQEWLPHTWRTATSACDKELEIILEKAPRTVGGGRMS